ncbi:MAG: cysteine--tRNA ligase [Candidatus Margulisiibacteriota bacterium]|nr:MAG: cysteine--tRNA ligase [Candidatus Margulisbacteria bacterium GWD2_39_127]OGI04318.1 MAG: cysteine--tRNA ligase [Candidatus Margulisbacteria bacterium GWF2_38_17]OGI11910.1 MAG: cysteine--tRNA ligase [Candidatus Margulisbacteria bacterium GWE2_39_32]PZM80021.1 MAG: cysteine--tRNA ligase [Candidatus Margulisiibacteriota bacterium]HAR62746.1 cysteine--tRNA ligase [Candidatus Margulisiibacteriota bacterium]
MLIYNTLKGKKEEFVPATPPRVSMYVCGVTVYDYCHIGHGRAYTVFDTIRRFLEYTGYNVIYIQNFTDIDDKIIKRAKELQSQWQEISTKFIDEYFVDMDSLNIQRATSYPKATEHIEDMIAMITTLVNKHYAYEIEGSVYFSVRSFPEYGKLSGRNLEDMQAGARVEVDTRKQHPMDFALWKKAADDEPGWASPWGKGRPGWHIECSAMSIKYLGPTFDIHGGGADLIFPHHENEIAQTEACSGKPFARYWVHNGFVNINKEKMSKSLGNFFTIREVLNDYKPEELRLFYLMTHYRKPINYSIEYLDDAKKALERLYNALYLKGTSPKGNNELTTIEKSFDEAMSDDFNTAQALGVLFELAKYINKALDTDAQLLLKKLGNILGILYQAKEENGILEKDIHILIEERNAARKNKNFARADEIRIALEKQGIILEDTPQGVRWKKK